MFWNKKKDCELRERLLELEDYIYSVRKMGIISECEKLIGKNVIITPFGGMWSLTFAIKGKLLQVRNTSSYIVLTIKTKDGYITHNVKIESKKHFDIKKQSKNK